MPSNFAHKKSKILQSLHVPLQHYTDLSPKGSLDDAIRNLCHDINALDGFVTTSSCAGRVTVFLQGPSSPRDEGHRAASTGGKGGGRWLYVSHDPVPLDLTHQEDEAPLFRLFGIDAANSVSMPSSSTRPRFVHFKFEPMILHILTSSLSNAQRALTAALSAGFRESGISGITGDDPTPIVAVRTQGLALESVIAFYDEASSTVCPMVTEGYLRILVGLANARFVANTERKARFHSALLQPCAGGPTRVNTADGGEWEPADVRAERKRAEGLHRREEMKRQRDTVDSEAAVNELGSAELFQQ